MPSVTPHPGRRLLVLVLALVIVVLGVGVPVAVFGPVPGPESADDVAGLADRTTAAAEPQLPDFGSSAVGMVGHDGLLTHSGSQSPRSMASITKIVTALVLLREKPLHGNAGGPSVLFTQQDAAILDEVLAAGGSWEPVQAGWRMTERQALTTMLLPSANNYADSLAIWGFGSTGEYLKQARAFLKAHGLTHTTVVSPDGLNPGNTSTPGDLVELGRLALASPVLTSIVRRSSATEPNVGLIKNTNTLIGDGGIDGIKTGTTNTGAANLLFTAPETIGTRTVQLIGVILHAKSHKQLDRAVLPLLKSVRAGFHEVRVSRKDQVFAEYTTAWGGTAKAIATRSASVLVWSRTTVHGTATLASIRGGLIGDRVGTVSFHVGSEHVVVPLALDRSLLVAPVWWRLTHPIR